MIQFFMFSVLFFITSAAVSLIKPVLYFVLLGEWTDYFRGFFKNIFEYGKY